MSVLIFLIVLSILVLIHEAGHFLAARLFGVKADEFGYGFPPRAFGFVKVNGKWRYVSGKDQTSYKNTIWSVNWLPLGGFVKIKGETPEGLNDPDSIHVKPIWQRLVIIAAGVMMNWLLAFVLFTGLFLSGTRVILDDIPSGAEIRNRAVVVTQVLPASPAEKAGIAAGDDILRISGQDATNFERARTLIQEAGTSKFDMVIRHDGTEKTVSLTPVMLTDLNRPGVGVGMADVGEVSFGFAQSVKNGAVATWNTTVAVLGAFGGIVKDLILTRRVTQDVSGPVGIAVMTGHIAKQGFAPLLQFAAMLSVNLAVINFLPIPALDGGRAIFLVIEAIRRKPLNRRIEIGIHNVAFLCLILLIVLVTIRDVSKFGGAIAGGLKGLVGM